MPSDQQPLFEAKCRDFELLYAQERIEELTLRFYAPEAVLEGSGLPTQRGRRAIQSVLAEARLECPIIRIALDPVLVTGGWAHGCQTNVNERADGFFERHRGLLIWRLIDNEWFVMHDFFFTKTGDYRMFAVGGADADDILMPYSAED